MQHNDLTDLLHALNAAGAEYGSTIFG